MVEQFITRLVALIDRAALVEGDDDDRRLEKAIVMGWSLTINVIAVVWGTIYLLAGAPLAAIIPYAYFLFSLSFILIYRRTRSLAFFRVAQISLILSHPTVLMLILGGYRGGSAVILWSLVAPLGALLVAGRKQAVRWMTAYVGLLIMATFLDPFVPDIDSLPSSMVTLFFFLNIATVSVIAFNLLYVFLGQKDAAIETNVQLYEDARRARAASEEANQAKSVFLANMSHEIRTPMNAVIGMTSLLRSTELTREQRDFTETIRRSSEDLLSIINDILDFSKMEAEKLEMEDQPFDLRDCIESALDLVGPMAASKSLELAYTICEATPESIVGDGTRLRQILVNLLGNAVKFTETGEIVLAVASTSLPMDERLRLEFSVRDTGIGIPKDRIPRLFQSFSQVDASTTRRHGGTGLGLAISKRLSELMGGSMWVESEEGVGTTFHFTIEARRGPGQDRVFLHSEQPELSGRRILIVDDNDTNRLIVRQYAESWGMVPSETDSPNRALELLRGDTKFDLAVIDMHMAEMNGIELASRIGADPSLQSLPVVMLTSLDSRIATDDADADLAACLAKPVKPSQLYNVLVEVLAGHPTRFRSSERPERTELDPRMGERLPLRILVAEDVATNQMLILRILERLGYRADVAANGIEALEALQRQPYDVLLMDVQMPEMDGLEATREILRTRPNDRPRIIALTANAMVGDREIFLQSGMDDYLSKPIRVPQLIQALEESHSLRRSLPAAAQEKVSSDTASHVDPGALDRLRDTIGDDNETLLQLIDAFLADVPAMLADLERAMDNSDAPRVRLAAHSLKSNGATFGAHALADVARQIEEQAMSGSVEGSGDLLLQSRAEYGPVAEELQSIRDSLSGAEKERV